MAEPRTELPLEGKKSEDKHLQTLSPTTKASIMNLMPIRDIHIYVCACVCIYIHEIYS